jgi:outer membrane protein OmpA-like peptidoglycan-associated protein
MATALPKAFAEAPAAAKPVARPPSAPLPAAVRQKPQRMAALPRTVESTAVGQSLELKFATESSSLSPDVEERLRALAGELSGETARLELKAYAGEADRTASAARRLSLSRALAVRSFLIEQGIRSTRIGVRAFGFPTDGGPSERVDVVLLSR